MKKRIISLIIAVILCVAMIVPASVNADVDTTKPYFEKLITVDGNKVTLKITLRGPNKSCCGGQVDIEYPVEKLTYDCPPIADDNTEMWDEELPWLIYTAAGVVNGHTIPGKFAANFFSARGVKTDQLLCEVTFTINEGYTVNASDFVCTLDLVADADAVQVDNPSPIEFSCTHKEYAADPESNVEPTCSTPGKTVEKCTSCGDVKETEVPATGVHNFVLDETKSIPATETTDGINYYDCADCDETKTEKVEKTGVADAKPYQEKVFATKGDEAELTITLRGPKAVCGGELSFHYNTDKLEYVTPGVDEEGYEVYDNEDWVISRGGSVNGLTEKDQGNLYISYFGAFTIKSGSTVVVFKFKIKDGAKIEESDIVCTKDLTFGTDGFENQMPSAMVYVFCDHLNYVEKPEENVAATCTTPGTKVYYCDNCGDKKVEEVPALGHDYKTETVAPTCTEVGTATTTCSRCDYKNVVDTPALGHDTTTATVDATCTEAGSKTTTCSRCDYKVVEEIAALDHDYKTETVDPTCTAEGSKTTTCSRCDYKNVESIAALGHKFSEPVVTKEPTCTEPGEETGTCTVCGETTKQAIAALGHDYKTETVDATCGADGSKTTTCSRCDYKNVEVIPATGNHDYVLNDSESTAPTCTEDGENVYYCSVCRDKKTETVDALGHDLSTVTVDATCGADGSKTTTCSRCDYENVEVIPATGDHNVEDADVSEKIEPTCDKDGKIVGICSGCGEEVEIVVPALGHKYDEGKITKDPTETEEGEKTFECEICGATKVEKIAKLDPKPETKPEVTPDADDTTKAPAGDATGDSAQLLLVSFIAVLSLAVLATIVFRNKATN